MYTVLGLYGNMRFDNDCGHMLIRTSLSSMDSTSQNGIITGIRHWRVVQVSSSGYKYMKTHRPTYRPRCMQMHASYMAHSIHNINTAKKCRGLQ
jgi:hypothetical protein